METIERSTSRPRPGRTWLLVGAGLVGGVLLAGFATASAQTPSPSAGEDDTATTAPAPGRGHGGRGKHGMGMGMGIHGEFVTANPAGDGWQTVATQKGEVTAVSPTSITVKSEDGFSRTYAVNDDTLVNAGNEGIDDVSAGDRVHVVAIVEGGTARAVRIHDATTVRELRGKWAPRLPRPPAASPSATS